MNGLKRRLVRTGIIALPVALIVALPTGWWSAVLAIFVAGQLVVWTYIRPTPARRASAER